VADPPLELDDHIVVACSPSDAAALFPDPGAVALWFGARLDGEDMVLEQGRARLQMHVTNEEWLPAAHALVVDGAIDGVGCRAHFTLRGVAAPEPGHPLAEGTEIWVHVELERPAGVAWVMTLIRNAVRGGLEHLRSELDCRPER
jgi:hypothetical protein